MNQVMEFISNVCPITGNGFIDTILFAVITFLAFKVAWMGVGAFSDGTGIHNSAVMSGIHWLIRFAVFLGLLSLSIGIVQLCRWMNTWQWWHYVIFAAVIANVGAGIALLIIFSKKMKKRNTTKKDEMYER